MLLLELGLLVAGIVVLAVGRFTIGTGRVLRGTPARAVGCLLMLPLPLALAVLFAVRFAAAQGVITGWGADELTAGLALFEFAVTGFCAVLAVGVLFATVPPPVRPVPVSPPPPEEEELWAEPADAAPVAGPLPARPAAVAPAVVRRAGVRRWVAVAGVAGGLVAGFFGGLGVYRQFFAAPAPAGPSEDRFDALRQLVERAEASGAEAKAAEAEARGRAEAAGREASELRKSSESARQQLEANNRELAAARKSAEQDRYFQQVAAAERELTSGNVARAEELLDGCPEALRGWEAARLRRLCRGEYPPVAVGQVQRILLDRTGRRLVTVPYGGHNVQVFDPVTGKRVFFLPREESGWSVVLSPDGRLFAGRDGQTVRDLRTGESLPALRGDEPGRGHLVFSPDGKRVASVQATPPTVAVTIRDAASGETVRSWNVRTEPALDVRFNGDGTPAWEGGPGQRPDAVTAVALGPDGRRLAVTFTVIQHGREEGWVVVCDFETGKNVVAHKYLFGPVAVAPDGNRIATLGLDGPKISDAATGKELVSIAWPGHWVKDLAFHPDGTKLATAGDQDGSVRLWDAADGRCLGVLAARPLCQPRVAFSPDGRLLFVAGQWSAAKDADAEVRAWPVAGVMAGAAPRRLPGDFAAVGALAFSPDGKRLASAHADRTVRVWDADALAPALTLTGHDATPRGLCWSADGKQLISVASPSPRERYGTGEVRVWDAATGAVVRTLSGPSEGRFLARTRDGKTLAAGGGAEVRLWDFATGKPLKRLPVQGPLHGLAFDPDKGRLIMVGPGVGVWDPETLEVTEAVPASRAYRSAAAVDPAAGRVALADFLGKPTTSVHALGGGAAAELRASGKQFTALAFSPDGRRLVSGGMDGEVVVWDPTTGRETLVLRGHGGPVSCVAFSHDGTRLASATAGAAGKGAEVFLWEAAP